MIDGSLRNLGVYLLQVVLLVAAAAVAASLLRLAIPRARLSYWRAVVFVCLVLPLIPVRHIDLLAPVAPTVTAGVVAAAPSAAPVTAPAQKRDTTTPIAERLLISFLAIGMVGRAIWLGVGLLRLGRLRRRGQPALLDEDVQILQRALAPHAEMRWHEGLPQPVTFGLGHPVVLLPRRLAALPIDIQRAVVCHELLHVARRDWLWTLVEECVRTLFWFHPAMRWALAQVQLSREETVDRLVVAMTGARRSYMAALMIFADEPGLAPAAAPFIRRNQLVVRLNAISQEVRMSPMRLAATGIALVGVLAGSSWGVVSAVPLHASVSARALAARPLAVPAAVPEGNTGSALSSQGALQISGADAERLAAKQESTLRIVPDARLVNETQTAQTTQPFRRVIKQVNPSYPPDLIHLGLTVDVSLRVTINALGDVTDAEAVSWGMSTTKNDAERTREAAITTAAQPFVDAAKAAVRQWKIRPAADSESTLEVMFTFRTKPDAAVAGGVAGEVVGGVGGGWILGGFRGRGSVGGGALVSTGTGPGASTGPGPGDGVRGGVIGGVRGGVGDGVRGGIIGGVPGGVGTTTPRPGELPLDRPVRLVRIGGSVKPPVKIFDVQPEYSDTARAANVQGVVIVELRIGTDGSVRHARILRSISLLDDAALEAVRQWRYEPVYLNDEPVEVVMTVTVDFRLP